MGLKTWVLGFQVEPQNLGVTVSRLSLKTWAWAGFRVWASKLGRCGFPSLATKLGLEAGFPVWASKPGADGKGWFPGLGHKTGGAEWWRHVAAI